MNKNNRLPTVRGDATTATVVRHARSARLAFVLCASLLSPLLSAKGKETTTRGITIESPAQGTIARPGSWVRVKLRLDPGLEASRASLLVGTWNELVSIVDEAPPFDLVLPIDQRWSGPIKVMYTVLAKGNRLVGSGELLINVLPSDTPVSIQVTDPVRMIAGSRAGKPQEHINVRGTYADGTVRDVGRQDLGTSFHSSDPRVVAVDGEGFLTAGAPGRAVVTVKNGALSKVVPVDVRPKPKHRLPPFDVASQAAEGTNSGDSTR